MTNACWRASWRSLACLATILIVAAGCGGKSPAAPTSPSSTPQAPPAAPPPNYQGAWTGSYFVRSCTATGEAERAKACEGFPVDGQAPITLSLTQDRDRVSGRIILGTIGGDVSGTISADGQLHVAGTLHLPVEDVVFNVAFTEWSAQLNANRLTGRFNMVWTIDGSDGVMTWGCELNDLERNVSAARAVVVPDARRAGSLGELIRRLVGIGR